MCALIRAEIDQKIFIDHFAAMESTEESATINVLDRPVSGKPLSSLPDMKERKRLQNRLAQRTYRMPDSLLALGYVTDAGLANYLSWQGRIKNNACGCYSKR